MHIGALQGPTVLDKLGSLFADVMNINKDPLQVEKEKEYLPCSVARWITIIVHVQDTARLCTRTSRIMVTKNHFYLKMYCCSMAEYGMMAFLQVNGSSTT